MNTQYDYQELIDELKDAVGDGSLEKEELIQVLRSKEMDKNSYFPIFDWYYNDATMTLELEADSHDSKDEIKDKMLLRDQYAKDKDALEAMTVEACLAELIEKVNG